MGWTEVGGDGTIISVPDLFNYMPSTTVTLKAVYEEAWTVTFKANGGTFYAQTDWATQDDQKLPVIKNQPVTSVYAVTLDGETPLGFVTDAGTFMTEAEVSSYVPAADMVFTAV